jgi:ABC-type multidrug transport system ATPase subunit
MGFKQRKVNCDSNHFITLKNLSVVFEGFKALNRSNLTLYRGETLAVVGEHGAGKSTLCKVLSGLQKPSSGMIHFNNKKYTSFKRKDTLKQGIELVSQYNPLFDELSVAQNLFTHPMITPIVFFPSKNFMKERAKQYFQSFNCNINPSKLAKNLNESDRAMVDIVKHICLKPKLLILDETLERLTSKYLDRIILTLNQLKKEGMSIIIVSHRIDDIYQFADRIMILRDGEILFCDTTKNIDKITVIRMAYTQIPKERVILTREFSQLIKYNEAILQKLPVNLIVTDNDNRIKMINDSAKEYFKVLNSYSFNMPLDELFSKNNDKTLNLIKNIKIENKIESYFNVPLTIKNNETINNILIIPIYEETFLIGKIVMIDDITEQERLREQVILSEKLASIGLLAAGVAHDINNPLEVSFNYLENLKFKSSDIDTVSIINKLEDELDIISQIVSNLISFSDSSKISTDNFELNDLIQNIINFVKYDAKYKNIYISLIANDGPIHLEANETDVKQVILNIIKNGIEAMPEGGKLTITTKRTFSDKHNSVQIICQDMGSGIEEENIKNIFLPFYSTKKNGESTNLGLGLSVSYGIIKKYDGDIKVTNLPEKGCQVSVTLPL